MLSEKLPGLMRELIALFPFLLFLCQKESKFGRDVVLSVAWSEFLGKLPGGIGRVLPCSFIEHMSGYVERENSDFQKRFPKKPCVSHILGGLSLRLGIPKERLRIPPGIG